MLTHFWREEEIKQAPKDVQIAPHTTFKGQRTTQMCAAENFSEHHEQLRVLGQSLTVQLAVKIVSFLLNKTFFINLSVVKKLKAIAVQATRSL